MKQPLAKTLLAKAGAGSAQGRADAFFSEKALKSISTRKRISRSFHAGRTKHPLSDLVRTSLTAAAILLWGLAYAQTTPVTPDKVGPSAVQAGSEPFCATEARETYLACFDEHRCNSRSLSEPARQACDACWQRYQKDTGACKALNPEDKKGPETRMSQSRGRTP